MTHLPYEDIPDGPVDLDVYAMWADHISVRAATREFPGHGTLPVLLFDFTSSSMPDVKLPTVAFVAPPETMLQAGEVVRGAIRGATREARKANG